MGSESIAHEAEGRMGYWLRGHEDERNNCLSKIQLVGQKYRKIYTEPDKKISFYFLYFYEVIKLRN